jgi:hypothetical protein
MYLLIFLISKRWWNDRWFCVNLSEYNGCLEIGRYSRKGDIITRRLGNVDKQNSPCNWRQFCLFCAQLITVTH